MERYVFEELDRDKELYTILYTLLANIRHGGLELEDALPKMNSLMYTKLDLDAFSSLIEYAEGYKEQKTSESQRFLTSLFDADGFLMKTVLEIEIEKQIIADGKEIEENEMDRKDGFQLSDVFHTILPDICHNLRDKSWAHVLDKFNHQFGCQITLFQLKVASQPLLGQKLAGNRRIYGTTIPSGDLLTATGGVSHSGDIIQLETGGSNFACYSIVLI